MLVLPQASVTWYVLVMTIGQVPDTVCALVTVKAGSEVHASAIWRFPMRASSAATVVTATGAAPMEHPSITEGVIAPDTAGAVVSLTLIVWTISTLVLPHTSVTLYILVITNGQAPVAVWLLVTTRLASGTHASVT